MSIEPYSIELNLRLSNDDLISSMVYQLERRFRTVTFLHRMSESLIICRSAQPIPREEIRLFISSFEDKTLRMGEKIRAKPVWQMCSEGTYNELPKSEFKVDIGGTIILNATLNKIIRKIDYVFESFSRKLGADEIRLPSLISEVNLVRCRYLPKQRHQVGTVYVDGGLKTTNVCLTPAACLPLYGSLENRTFPSTTIFSFCSSTYRYEDGVFSSANFERNWEYPLRECVVFSDGLDNEKLFGLYADFMMSFSKSFLSEAQMASASDTFFDMDSSPVALHQLMHANKFEVSYVDREKKKLAISSFNIHGRSFTDEYNICIGDQGTRGVSLCMAWGLVRILKALLESGRFPIDQLEKKLDEFAQENVWNIG